MFGWLGTNRTSSKSRELESVSESRDPDQYSSGNHVVCTRWTIRRVTSVVIWSELVCLWITFKHAIVRNKGETPLQQDSSVEAVLQTTNEGKIVHTFYAAGARNDGRHCSLIIAFKTKLFVCS
jgi:hypothetical protein